MKHFLLLIALLGGGLGIAAAKGGYSFVHPFDEDNPNAEEYVWGEVDTVIPPYPKPENLIEFYVDQPQNRFNYYIDRTSLTIGDNDVAKYILVVRSKRGGETVSYEGVRCQTREYKSYAFGNGRGAFKKVRKPTWRSVDRRSNNLYRLTLTLDFLCNVEILGRSSETILQHMQHSYRLVGEDRFD